MSQALQFDAEDPADFERCMATLEMHSQIVIQGYRYWMSRRGGRAMPQRRDLDPIIDIPQLTPHIILFDVRHEPLDFRFRLVGTVVRHNLSRDYAGHWFSEYPNYDASGSIWPRHKLVHETGKPMLQRPTYIGPHNDFIYVENVLMPLATETPGWSMQLMFIDFIRRQV